MRNFPFVVSFSIVFMFLLGISAPAADQGAKAPPTVVHVHLSGTVIDSPRREPPLFTGGVELVCLKDLLERFENLRDDPKVAGVIVTFNDFSAGLGQLEEIGNAFAELKAAKKPVYVHAETLESNLYAAVCGGTKLNMPPESNLYLKGLLDKIGVRADIIQMGRYKAAGEEFTRAEPSKAAAENMNWLMDGLYGELVDTVAKARALTPDKVRSLIDHGPYSAKEALAAGLIDSSLFLDQFVDVIKKDLGGEIVIDNNYGESVVPGFDLKNPMALLNMFSEMGTKSAAPANAVAVLFAEGMIASGYGGADVFSGDVAHSGVLRHALESAAADDSVKAVVLRVNSPGGAVTACEVILHAEERFKESGKPLVVSMGDVAASGGYYIACAGDVIFVDASTITGSIGVIGGKPVASGLMAMIGVSPYAYKRGANADLGSVFQGFTPAQEARINEQMVATYDIFKGHVRRLRGEALKKPIGELAGGRVFTGRQAVDSGLADRLGGLTAAVAQAAKLANVTNYEWRIIPEPKTFFERLKEAFTGTETNYSDISARLAAPSAPRLGLGVPGLFDRFEPRLGRRFRASLRKLDLLRRHRVLMATPYEIIVR